MTNSMIEFPNFKLSEFIDSDTALIRKIKNVPDFGQVENLKELVSTILQPLRSAWGRPITVTSGYRCPELNKAVGGVLTSAHMRGEAADLQTERFAEFVLFTEDFLKANNIAFDQMLIEKSGRTQWLHISLRSLDGKQRREIKSLKV